MNSRDTTLVEFQGDELRSLLAHVGQGVSVPAGQPFHVSGLEVSRHGGHAFHVLKRKILSEARYQRMFTNHGSDLSYLPVTFGICW
jgi:hypothetical protein